MAAIDHNAPWMQTYTGKQSWPLNIQAAGLDFRDAAHALGMQCRYAGHCIFFYSVAEHSVQLYRYAKKHDYPAPVQKALLMHDWTEYLLVDVPRAVKPELKDYKPLEHRLAEMIADKYRVTYPWPAEVNELDNRILLDERAQNMTRFLREDEYHKLDDPEFLRAHLNTPAGYTWCDEEASGWPFHLPPLYINLNFYTPKQAERAMLDAFEECKDY